METLVYDSASSTYLVNVAHIARKRQDIETAAATAEVDVEESDWDIDKSSPFVTWIAGDFVEGDKPNSNTQFWTSNDLALSEYSIKYSPLNMIHKFRTPIGFYAATKTTKLAREEAAEGESLKISALSGLWSHIFPFETALAEMADAQGLLFYSMECRGTHLNCAGPNGCGETFEYLASDTHCEHLQERSSVRHIVNPTFRGGALIVPPTRPGWKEAKASVITDAVMSEAASFAEQNEAAYNALTADGTDLTAAGWEQLMAMVVGSTKL